MSREPSNHADLGDEPRDGADQGDRVRTVNPDDEPSREGRKGGLASKTTTGLVFMVLQTVLLRFVRLGGQIVLAYLLIPDDFAVFGLAVTIAQFNSIIRQAGVRDILVHRGAKAQIWTNAAFWMTLSIGLVSGLLLAASAPLLAGFYGRTELVPLILVLAVASPIQSIGQIAVALLQAKLRFKLLAIYEGVNNTLLMVFTIIFASFGMGPMSFILPMLIVALLRLVVLYPISKPRIRLNPQLGRWKYLIGDSVRLMGAGLARALVTQGDYIVLGRMFPGSAAIGHYFYAYQLSNQTVALFGRNLDLVLYPVLSSIQDDGERQRRGFIRALRAMAIGGIPMCFLQAAAAEPLFMLLLPEKWHAALPYIVILSIGMAGRLMIAPSMAMLRAQGRFSAHAWTSWLYAISFVASAAIVASLAGPDNASGMVATTVSINISLWGFLFVYLCLMKFPGALRDTLRVFTLPTLVGAAACGAGYGVSLLIPTPDRWMNILRLAVIGAVSFSIYAPIMWTLDRESCRELLKPVSSKLGKLLGRKNQHPS